MNTKICPTCKAPIPANAPGGFCPACILRSADEPAPAGRAAPSLADVSAAFPQLEVQALIGQGGMGFVYKVRQPSLDRVVALKILSPELGRDPAFAERFAREARVLGKLNHPNIVTVFEHGESGGFFYLLMEFVDGVNLRQAMRAGRFTPPQALAVVPGICDALQAAHAQGVWHRDIKPENILLDARGGVKIADFGIARIVGDPERDFTLTATGAALGSAAYMAPEQHESPHDVDHRADIYSLGVVIYEMLTGELPLGRFPAPSRRASVSAHIDDIVLRTLEKERELRQQSATEVKTDVQGAATAVVPAAKEPSSKSTSPLSRLPRLAFWSLAFLIGGVALAGASHVVGEFSHGSLAVGAAMSVLLTIAGAAGAFGFLGSLWSLYEMKRGWMATTGRWLLIVLTIVPLAVGAIIMGGGVGYFAPIPLPPEKGSVLKLMGFYYGFLSLALGVIFLLARPLQPATPLRRRFGSACLALAACAAVGSALLAKRGDYHWPHVFYSEEAKLKLFSDLRPQDDQVLALLKRAAGPFADDYELSVSNGVARVVALTRQNPRRGERGLGRSKDSDIPHASACLARLRDLLPPSAVHESVTLSDESSRDPSPRNTLAVLASLAALLAALAGGRRAVWVVGGGVVLHGVLIALPVWPSGNAAPPRLIDAAPLPPLTVAELPAPDFNTPEKAVMSVYDAACFGRLEVVKRGMSKALIAALDEKDGWAEFMERHRDRRFAVLPGKLVERDGGQAVAGTFITRDGRRTGDGGPSLAVLEDGEWKLDSLDSRYRPTARARHEAVPAGAASGAKLPATSVEEVFRKMNAAANESDGEEFRKHTDITRTNPSVPYAEVMAPFFGKVIFLKTLPDEGANQQIPGIHNRNLRVLAALEDSAGAVRYTEFLFVPQNGEWRFSEPRDPEYRVAARVEFRPEKGNPLAILRSHVVGNVPITPVNDTEGQFEIAAGSTDADVAARGANSLVKNLESSLTALGLNRFFKIIKPADRPTKPWMADDGPVPTKVESRPGSVAPPVAKRRLLVPVPLPAPEKKEP